MALSLKDIISRREKILNNLFEGLIISDELLTNAQTYRKTALEIFLKEDIHHRDLAEVMDKLFESRIAGKDAKFLEQKIIDYITEGTQLNKEAGYKVIPGGSASLDDAVETGRLAEKLGGPFYEAGDGISRNSLKTYLKGIFHNLNQNDLYMGIRHVMPESLEMRMLINHGQNIITALSEYIDNQGIDVAIDFAWDREGLIHPKNIKWNQYKNPKSIDDLEMLHRNFLKELPNKAKEFILGDNILLEKNPEPRLYNDFYYQYAGFATYTGDMAIMQMQNALNDVYKELIVKYEQELMADPEYIKAAEKNWADDWEQAVKSDRAITEKAIKLAQDDINQYFKVSPFDEYGDDIEIKLGPVDEDTLLFMDIEEVINNPYNIDPPPNQTLKVMEETGLSAHSDRIRKVAQDYHKIMGYSDPEFKPAMVFNDEIGAVAADIFEKLPMFEDTAIPYYRKFIQETNMQYQVLLDNGMQFEIVDADPYTPNKAGHQQMINDMENGVLKVLATESGFGDEATSKLNPMLAESTYTDINGRVMLENDVFRAVHDTFGHGMRGNTFGPIGEYNAWLAHKEMYSSDARRVMTTETLGQNTFTNYGPHMRDANGNLLGKADAGYIKPADRPFASQKVALMPEEIIDIAGKVVEDASELVDTEGLNKLVQLANTQPEVVDGIMKTAKNVVGKTFSGVAGVLDPGDVAITQGLTRVLPRLGLAAISAPALAAYIGYELAILAIDVGQAYNKAIENQGGQNDFIPSFMGGKTIEGKEPTYIDYDWKQVGKDTWEEFGEVSDTWSLSWKISEPIIDYAFKEYAKLQEDR